MANNYVDYNIAAAAAAAAAATNSYGYATSYHHQQHHPQMASAAANPYYGSSSTVGTPQSAVSGVGPHSAGPQYSQYAQYAQMVAAAANGTGAVGVPTQQQQSQVNYTGQPMNYTQYSQYAAAAAAAAMSGSQASYSAVPTTNSSMAYDPLSAPAYNSAVTRYTEAVLTQQQMAAAAKLNSVRPQMGGNTNFRNNNNNNRHPGGYFPNGPGGGGFFPGNPNLQQVPQQPINNNNNNNGPNNQNKKRKNMDKLAQSVVPLFFCDICKVSCLGESSYNEHLKGGKHSKKAALKKSMEEAAAATAAAAAADSSKAAVSTPGGVATAAAGATSATLARAPVPKDINNYNKRITSISMVVLRCKLCETNCVSVDSYRSHVRGTKHHRVLSVHTQLGKPIPSVIPEIVSTNVSKAVEQKIIQEITAEFGGSVYDKNAVLKEVAIVGDNKESATVAPVVVVEKPTFLHETSQPISDEADIFDAKPIGHDFIEEVLNESGKIVCFTCTLCECRFNDPNAKEMHLKGRRHRLQYKKKVDPSLIVEFIKNDRQKIEKERKQRLQRTVENPECIYFSTDFNPFDCPNDRKFFQKHGPHNGPPKPPMPYTLQKTFSDLILDHKHSLIAPRHDELEFIYQVTHKVEKALRFVSNIIDHNFVINNQFVKENCYLNAQEVDQKLSTNSIILSLKPSPNRMWEFMRVIRAGPLAKGYLLAGELRLDLIVLCKMFPTTPLMTLFVNLFPEQFRNVAKDESAGGSSTSSSSSTTTDTTTTPTTNSSSSLIWSIEIEDKLIDNPSAFRIRVGKAADTLRLEYLVTFTSPYIRNTPDDKLNAIPNILDKFHCQEALSEIRHLRWHKEKISHFHYYQFTIRILRDLCARVKSWSKVTLWTLELILERIFLSAGVVLSPSSLFRHIFEFFSFGVCMIRGSGLGDPCESGFPNIFGYLQPQDMEDLMSSAQHTVRLIGMRQLHKVVAIDSADLAQLDPFHHQQPLLGDERIPGTNKRKSSMSVEMMMFRCAQDDLESGTGSDTASDSASQIAMEMNDESQPQPQPPSSVPNTGASNCIKNDNDEEELDYGDDNDYGDSQTAETNGQK